MTVSDLLFKEKVHLGSYLFWYVLFRLFEGCRCYALSRGIIWQFLKLELYRVLGACQHSGYCCNHMMLTYNGKDVVSDALFSSLKHAVSSYDRFKPRYDSEGRILYFTCSCLNSENQRCLDYENRPSVCRQYPFSTFFHSGYIRKGCGYKVARKEGFPRISYLPLKRLVDEVDQKMVL